MMLVINAGLWADVVSLDKKEARKLIALLCVYIILSRLDVTDYVQRHITRVRRESVHGLLSRL